MKYTFKDLFVTIHSLKDSVKSPYQHYILKGVQNVPKHISNSLRKNNPSVQGGDSSEMQL